MMLEQLGIPVLQCAELRDDVCWIPDQGIAIIRPDLSDARLRAAIRWLLTATVFQA
jgi:hypothetical protein